MPTPPADVNTGGPAREPRRRAWGIARREGRALLELFTLSGFAIAQPLLDLFGRAAAHVAFLGADRADVIAFGLIVLLAPPGALWLVEILVGLVSPRARRVVHLGFLGALAAILVAQVARNLPDAAALALALIAGALVGLTIARFQAARIWLSFAALAPPVFLALFLTGSDTARLFVTPEVAALEAGIGAPAPVVLVVFDELPLSTLLDVDGGIDRELYPNVAAFADDAHWFRNATTVSTATWHAIPALATGRPPIDATVATAADHPENLFTLLGGSYELNIVESVSRLCPSDLCDPPPVPGGGTPGLLRDANRVLRARLPLAGDRTDPIAGLVEGTGEVEGTEEIETDPVHPLETEGIEDLARVGHDQQPRLRSMLDGVIDDRPALHYLHILLPHLPYRYLPTGVRYPYPDPDPAREADIRAEDPWLADLDRQRLALQTSYTDSLLGEVLETLRDRGIYDDALVIFTADHGIAFHPGRPIRGLDLDGPIDDELAAQIMWVPLMIKEPGQAEGTVRDGDVTLLDVVPTIADALALDMPWEVEGRSALGPDRPLGTKTLFKSEITPWYVSAGEPYEIDGQRGWELVLGESVGAFLPGAGDRWRAYRLGPAPELVGQPAAEHQDRLAPVEARLIDPGAFDEVDRASGTLPALVRARLEGVEAGTPLAVVIGDVIAAVVPAHAAGDSTALSAMVPDWVLQDGANQVRVHRLAVEP